LRQKGGVHDQSVTNGVDSARGAVPAARDAETRESKRPGAREKERRLLDFQDQLSATEQKQIRFVQSTFEPGRMDTTIRFAQKYIGSRWIEHCTKNIRHVNGLDRLPRFDPKKSYLVVANHRSFFDLYTVTGYLVYREMPHRLVFPVRSNFFYDKPLGLFVNGVMSFFAMYPPVFRERSRAALNHASLDETTRLHKQGGAFVGLHPEGQRNKSDNPYELLPAQGGVGRVIQAAGVTVLPVFINGLGNDLPKQIAGNFTKKGTPIIINFGAPVDFGDMLTQPPSPRLHKKISEHALDQIRRLGDEEREIRASLR
jgi:1-acyl-sn-glycerol-3-phosphate acyltransferase